MRLRSYKTMANKRKAQVYPNVLHEYPELRTPGTIIDFVGFHTLLPSVSDRNCSQQGRIILDPKRPILLFVFGNKDQLHETYMMRSKT